MKHAGRTIFWILIFTGLFVRLYSLSYSGIFDMDVYYEWGNNALNYGLSKAYQSIYFPFQFQVFEAGAWLTLKTGYQYYTVFKGINLLFDCGSLIILYLIFKKLNISRNYLLVYWLHPWFILVFSQGYCDFQFTFFILLFLYTLMSEDRRKYLIAGIFLGLALFMKPQVEIVALVIFLYCAAIFVKEKDYRPFQMFVFPAVLFLDYTLYFSILSGDITKVLRAYVRMSDSLPLTANFLNAWFPVAYFMKAPGDPIYAPTDNMTFLGLRLRAYALLSLFILIFLFLKRILKSKEYSGYHKDMLNFYLLSLFGTFVFPFIMTSAHENHLFLATVLFIPLYGMIRDIIPKICIHIILILQAINLFGFYGAGGNLNINKIITIYTLHKAFILSLVAFSAFLALSVYFINPGNSLLRQVRRQDAKSAED